MGQIPLAAFRVTGNVITIINREATGIIQTLLNGPVFADLSTRKQADFSYERVGAGRDVILLHQARLDQLDEESAQKFLKSPDKVKDFLSRFDRTE